MTFGDFISAASVLIAAVSFVWGVRAWRSAFLGQKRIELAEEVHELFLTCIDHISAIRSPISYSEEGKTRLRNGTETPGLEKLLDQAYVPMERIQERLGDFNKLKSKANRFDLFFGPEASKPITMLYSVVRKIQWASNDLAYIWPNQGQEHVSQEAFQKHLAEMHAAQAVIWGGHAGDPLEPEIKEAVERMTETCKQAINPQFNFWKSGRAGLLWIERFLALPTRS